MKKILMVLTILGLVTPLASHAFFFGVGTSSGVDQVIKKGQESGAISNQPGDNGPGPSALAISGVSYPLIDAGDYFYANLSFNTNKSVTKIEVNWFRADGWNFSKYKNTSGTSHILPIKYLKPNTTTYFVIKAYTATENVQSAQYSVAVSNGDSKVYDVYMNIASGQIRLRFKYFVTSPPDNWEARCKKNGGSWNSWIVDPPSGQQYFTDYVGSGWQTGDQLDIDFYNPSNRSETNIQDTILYGNTCF